MKTIALILFLLVTKDLYSQNARNTEIQLNRAFKKIAEWSDDKYGNQSYDSLSLFNNQFEKLALNLLNKNSETLRMKFNQLTKIGLQITTSEDGLLRIYSWDDQTGGTMRRFRNIYQIKSASITKAFTKADEDDLANLKIYDLIINNRKYYLLSRFFTGSTALFHFKLQLLSIEKDKLNDKAKLIITKTGLKNNLIYEVDYSASLNRNSNDKLEHFYPNYNHDKKEISIPLLLADGKFTNKRIIYRLCGNYFKKTN